MIEQSIEEVAQAMTENPKAWAENYLTLKADYENLVALLKKIAGEKPKKVTQH